MAEVETTRSNLDEFTNSVGRKRGMGQGIKSCKNLNAWRHLFRPNSPSALQGEIDCDVYWGRSAGIDTTRGGNLDEFSRSSQSNGTPTIGSQPINIKTRTKSKPVELDFEQSRNPFMLERYLPGSEPQDETKESSYQWLFYAAIVAAIIWMLKAA
jgi:hypothetical protein